MDPRAVSFSAFLALALAACSASTGSTSSSSSSSSTSSSPPPAPVRSSFDAGDEGWTLQGFNSDANDFSAPLAGTQPVTWEASGGDPGGAIQRNETFFGYADYFTAPAKFRGDLSAFYRGTLSWELIASDVAAPFQAPLLVVQTAHGVFRYDGGPYAATTWTSFSVPLDASAAGWTAVGGGAPVTDDVLRAALASVTALWIRGEFSSDIDGSTLDEVVLQR